MAKKEDKCEAVMILQIVGHGHPCTIYSDRIQVDKYQPVEWASEETWKSLMKEIAGDAYKKLKERLPRK